MGPLRGPTIYSKVGHDFVVYATVGHDFVVYTTVGHDFVVYTTMGHDFMVQKNTCEGNRNVHVHGFYRKAFTFTVFIAFTGTAFTGTKAFTGTAFTGTKAFTGTRSRVPFWYP